MADDGIDESNPLYDAVQRAKNDPTSTYNNPDAEPSPSDSSSSDSDPDNRTAEENIEIIQNTDYDGVSQDDVESSRSSQGTDSRTDNSDGGSDTSSSSGASSTSSGSGSDATESTGSGAGASVDDLSFDEVSEEELLERSGNERQSNRERQQESSDTDGGSGGGGGGDGGGGGRTAEENTAIAADIDDPADDTLVDRADNPNVPDQTEEAVAGDAVEQLNEDTAGSDPFDRGDVSVTTEERNGETVAVPELTDSGQRLNQSLNEARAADTFSQQLSEQTGDDVTPGDDFTVEVSDGQATAEFTDSYRLESAAAQSERYDADDLELVGGDIQVTDEGRLEAAAQQSDQYDADDLELVGGDVEVTDEGLREAAAQQSDQFQADDLLVDSQGDVFVSTQAQKEQIAAERSGVSPDDVVLQDTRTDSGDIETKVFIDEGNGQRRDTGQTEGDFFSGAVSGFEDATGVDVPGEGSLVDSGAENRESVGDGDGSEAFGGRGDFEQGLRSGAEDFRGGIENVASEVGDLVQIGGAAYAAGSPVTANDPAKAAGSDSTGEELGNVAQGSVEGAGEILNAPQYGVTAIEVGEVGVAAAESAQITKARPNSSAGEFAGELASAGAFAGNQAAQYASENPSQFAGQLAGGLIVGSAGQTALRNRVSNRGSAGRSTGSGTSTGSSGSSSGIFEDLSPNVDVDVGRNVARGRFDVNVNRGFTRPTTGRNTDFDLRERAETALRNTEVSADAAVQAGRQRLSNAADRAARAPREVAEGSARRASETGGDVLNSVRNAEVSADAAVQAGRQTVTNTRNRATLAARRARRDLGLPTVPRGYITDGDSGRSLLPDVDRPRPVDLVDDALESLNDGFDEFRSDALNRVRSAEVSADAAVQAGQQSVTNARNRATLATRRARRDIGFGEAPRGFVTEADDGGGRSFLSDTEGRQADPTSALDAASSVRGRFSSGFEALSELGIRVDVGKPGRTTVDADDMEIGDVGVSYDRDLDGSLDGDGTGDRVQVFEADADATGAGTVAFRRSDTEADARPRVETETNRRQPNRRSGGLLGGLAGLGAAGGSSLGFGVGPELDAGVETVSGAASETDVSAEVSDILGPDIGSDVGTPVMSGTTPVLTPDQDIGPVPETSTRITTETETPQRPENDLPPGSSFRPPRPPFDFGDNRDSDQPSAEPFEIGAETFDTGVVQSLDDL